MSVAGLKKQFYKASQVSGGRGGERASGPGLPRVRGQTRPDPDSEVGRGGRGHRGGGVGTRPRLGGQRSGGTGAASEVTQAQPAMWAPVSSRRVGRPPGAAETHPEVDPGLGPPFPSPPLL